MQKKRFVVVLLAILLFATFKVFSESKEFIDTSKTPQLVLENSLWKAKAWGKGYKYEKLDFPSNENIGIYYHSEQVWANYFSDYAYVQMEMKVEGLEGQKQELYNLQNGGCILRILRYSKEEKFLK